MRTEQNLSALIAQLTSNCGDMFGACSTVGLSLHFVNTWMKDDEKVREQIAEATRLGAMRLESAAIKRAVHGVEEPVFYQGDVCGYKTNYSDGLLTKLLEARVPGFKKGDEGGNTFNGPTQINIMPRAENYQQWLDMRTKTLDTRNRNEALPPPDNDVVDVEFTAVESSPLAGLGL